MGFSNPEEIHMPQQVGAYAQGRGHEPEYRNRCTQGVAVVGGQDLHEAVAVLRGRGVEVARGVAVEHEVVRRGLELAPRVPGDERRDLAIMGR